MKKDRCFYVLDTHVAPTRSQVAAAATAALRQAPLLPSEDAYALTGMLSTGAFDPPPAVSPYHLFAARRAAAAAAAAAEGEGLAVAASAGSSSGNAAPGFNLKRKQ